MSVKYDKKAVKAAKFIGNKLSAGYNKAKDFVKFGLKGAPEGEGSGYGGMGSDPEIRLLIQIRDVLRERLPKGKRKIVGDADGDGVREGSYADMLARKKKQLGDGFGRFKVA